MTTREQIITRIKEAMDEEHVQFVWTGRSFGMDVTDGKPWFHVASTFVVFKNYRAVYSGVYKEGVGFLRLDGFRDNPIFVAMRRGASLKNHVEMIEEIEKHFDQIHTYACKYEVIARECYDLEDISSRSFHDFLDEYGDNMENHDLYMKCSKQKKMLEQEQAIGRQSFRRFVELGRELQEF